MPTKNIVWLASYPKSGNTWTRIFLANYFFGGNAPLPINQVHRIGIGDSVPKAYQMVARHPVDPKDQRQTLALRGKVLKAVVANDADMNFVKTHNMKTKAHGVELIPPALSRMAIYIIRNPLDMVLSYARHFGHTPEAAVRAICHVDNATAGTPESVTQYLGDWSTHVRSWTRTKDFPVHVMRYEDMLADPETLFAALLRKLGVEPRPQKLADAVRFSSFDEVSRQEAKQGFIERSPKMDRFFHSGTAGQWKDTLAPELVERIRTTHGAVMAEYGYACGPTAPAVPRTIQSGRHQTP